MKKCNGSDVVRSISKKKVKIISEGESTVPDKSNTNSKTEKIAAVALFLFLINMTVFVMLNKCKKKKTG